MEKSIRLSRVLVSECLESPVLLFPLALFIGNSVGDAVRISSDNLNRVSPINAHLSIMILYYNSLSDLSEFVSGRDHVMEFVIT